MPSLRRTLAVQITAVIVFLLIVSAAAVWGIRGLRQDFSVATHGYERLRSVYEVGAHVSAARTLMSLDQTARAVAELRAASLAVEGGGAEMAPLAAHLAAAAANPRDERPYQQALGAVRETATQIRQSIRDAQRSGNRKQRLTIIAVATLGGVLIAGAIVIGVAQYRAIVRHTQLEKQLVRSERLASVGFLAAGVAHEINNPLGVITGFAEFTLERLKAGGGDAETVKALHAICDEAFRCKAITEKLLSMARSPDAPRGAVDLAAVAKDVIALTAVLRDYQGRRVSFDADGDTRVAANEAEMKQVVLNLLTNALNAGGDVTVAVRQAGKAVELSVKDAGRGMSPQTLTKIFEPFFTLPRQGRRGTGLGLSIAQAIVENHHGTIRAASAGEGQGSEFVVTLPLSS